MDSLWIRLEQDITSWLSSYSSNSIEFRNSHQAIVGFPPDGPRSDGMLSDKNTFKVTNENLIRRICNGLVKGPEVVQDWSQQFMVLFYFSGRFGPMTN